MICRTIISETIKSNLLLLLIAFVFVAFDVALLI